MKLTTVHTRLLCALAVVALMLSACVPTVQNQVPEEQPAAPLVPTAIQPSPDEPPPRPPQAAADTGLPDAGSLDLDSLAVISPDNITGLVELARISPWYPPHSAISADGRIAALGGLEQVQVFERDSGQLLMEIPADLPECQFGAAPVMLLNADGSFLALVTREAVQVWQVGGGLLYESPFSRDFSTDPFTCGRDMPQLALSSDGRRLAVSGMAYSRDSLDAYFRVIDILKNEILYEWDGSPDSLHGSLSAYQGLGFSSDGSVLTVFDALRFVSAKGQPHSAFRFWSTTDWQEIPARDARLPRVFARGELLYPLFTDTGTEVRTRTSGALTVRLTQAPCSRAFPCEARFSPDGSHLLLLSSEADMLPFKDIQLTAALSMMDVEGDVVLSQPEGLFRGLEGLLLEDDGTLVRAYEGGTPDLADAWWVRGELFDGLLSAPDGTLYFVPQVFYPSGPAYCPYCATCRLDLSNLSINCRSDFLSSEGAPLALDETGGETVLSAMDGDNKIRLGALELPESSSQPQLYVRLLGASIRSRAVFYCLESNQRALGCFIRDVGTNTNLSEADNLSLLRFSPDGRLAVFFDERGNDLVQLDLDSGRLTRRGAYEARAYPVAAHFYDSGSSLAFVIQSGSNSAVFWLELLEAESGRSVGRVALNEAGLDDPTLLAADPAQRMWLLGDRTGQLAALGFEDGSLLHSWQAHAGGLIGLNFSSDGRLLVTIGENGIISLWGVS